MKEKLALAWKLQRKDPAKALDILDEIVNAIDDRCLLSKCYFLMGKIHIEFVVDFGSGVRLLCQALGVDNVEGIRFEYRDINIVPEEEVCGWFYHLSRALYFDVRYKESWEVVQYASGSVFPEISSNETKRDILCKQWKSGVNKYHRGMLLHLIVLSVVYKTEEMAETSQLVDFAQTWLDQEEKTRLWHQYNAEVRFASLVMRLEFDCRALGGDMVSEFRPKDGDIYVLGESHILSLVFRRSSFIPRLVIGLKARHFNPKLQHSRERGILLEHISSIRLHSTIIVCAGEIDLRPNNPCVTQKTSKGKVLYESQEQAICATISDFCAGLVALRDSRAAENVIVIPIRPVPTSCKEQLDWSDKTIASVCECIRIWNEKLEAALQELEKIVFLRELCDDVFDKGMDRYDLGDGVHLNLAFGKELANILYAKIY